MHMCNMTPECLSLIRPHQTNPYPVSCSAVSSCQQQLFHNSNMLMLNCIHQSCESLLHKKYTTNSKYIFKDQWSSYLFNQVEEASKRWGWKWNHLRTSWFEWIHVQQSSHTMHNSSVSYFDLTTINLYDTMHNTYCWVFSYCDLTTIDLYDKLK